jgi:predicted methyltransferase
VTRFLLVLATLVLSACQSMPGNTISRERIAEIVASPDRSEADRINDRRRRPELLFAFMGLRPGMTVLDVSAGGGYTTEFLARAVGPGGKVYGQVPANAERVEARRRNPALSHIVPVVRSFNDPVPPEVSSNALDLVTLMFNYHDFGHMGVDRARLNRAVFAALKPGGFYIVADHSGRPGTGISESSTLHRIEESFLRKEVEAAGFRLAEEGNFLRNPNDPRDRNTPEPPMPKDEFVLKFVKP